MCEQCASETIYYITEDTNNILPGYVLVRATKDGWEMKKDDWGLVRCNDPDFIWSVTPVCDPDDGLTDEQINALPEDKKRYKSYEKAVKNLQKVLDRSDFDYCVYLGNAMKEAGWSRDNDGMGAYWLCNHIGKFLKTAKAVKELEDRGENND